MRIVSAVLGLAYPLLVYLALQVIPLRIVALGLGALFLVRALAAGSRGPLAPTLRALAGPGLGLGAVLGLTWFYDDPRYLLAVPALVNAVLLASFARSLWVGPPIVETFARLQSGSLSAEEVAYCRRVTEVWCAFFAGNGALAAALAWSGDLPTWTLYNGVVAYLAMGTLFGAELLYRSWRFRRYDGGLADPLLRRVFPPRPPA